MNTQSCWYKRICTEQCSENCIRYKLMYSLFKQSNLPEALWEYKELICHEKDLSVYELKNVLVGHLAFGHQKSKMMDYFRNNRRKFEREELHKI